MRTSKILTVDKPDLSQAEKLRLVRRMIVAIVTNRILQHVWVCAWQDRRLANNFHGEDLQLGAIDR